MDMVVMRWRCMSLGLIYGIRYMVYNYAHSWTRLLLSECKSELSSRVIVVSIFPSFLPVYSLFLNNVLPCHTPHFYPRVRRIVIVVLAL
jgi:hypothetical protein